MDIIHTIPRWPREGDLVRISEQVTGVGGGAANILTDLRLLGAPFRLAAFGCVGDDANAAIIRDHCARVGLDVEGLVSLPTVATAHTHVMSVAGENRTFFYHAGANDALTPEHVPVATIGAARFRIFYLGYLMLLGALDRLESDGTTGASRLLAAARAAGMLTCVDLVSDRRPDFARIVAPSLPHCDYLISNEIEAAQAAEVSIRAESGAFLLPAAHDAARRLLDHGVARAVVIHAPEGALWHERDGEPVWLPALPIPPEAIVSSVGAGDAFCAGVLYGLHEGWSPDRILAIAHRIAVASLAGATATSGIGPIATYVNATASVA